METGTAAMTVGLLLGGLRTARELGALAARAEALGFTSLWAGDHVAFPSPILDPLQVLAAFAAHTQRVRLGTCVYLLPLRPPAVVAKMVASLDFVTGGRVIFGVGVGGEFPAEFQACGVPVGERGPRTDEAIVALRRLWQGGRATHHGRRFDIGPVEIAPAPVQGANLPIWIGGRSEAALRRAARHGDGYVGYMLDVDGFGVRMARIRELAASRGRDPGALTPALMAFALVADDRREGLARAAGMLGAMYGRAMEEPARRYCIVGTPDECRDRVRAYAAAGVEHLVLTPLAFGDACGDQIEKLAEALGLVAAQV